MPSIPWPTLKRPSRRIGGSPALELLGCPAEALESAQDKAGMIRKLKSGGYRLYSVKKDPKTGKRRNLGTFKTRAAAVKHERAVQFFKRKG